MRAQPEQLEIITPVEVHLLNYILWFSWGPSIDLVVAFDPYRWKSFTAFFQTKCWVPRRMNIINRKSVAWVFFGSYYSIQLSWIQFAMNRTMLFSFEPAAHFSNNVAMMSWTVASPIPLRDSSTGWCHSRNRGCLLLAPCLCFIFCTISILFIIIARRKRWECFSLRRKTAGEFSFCIRKGRWQRTVKQKTKLWGQHFWARCIVRMLKRQE